MGHVRLRDTGRLGDAGVCWTGQPVRVQPSDAQNACTELPDPDWGDAGSRVNGTHVDKGYIYFAMAFALVVELLNLRMKAKAAARKPAKS